MSNPNFTARFSLFYYEHFHHEHRHPANIALHIVGVLGGFSLIIACSTFLTFWWIPLFPIIFVAPGLIGHRLFEQEANVGDLRITRTDFPLSWFLIGNVLLTIRILSFGKFF